MPKYIVTVTRTETSSANIEVNAKNDDEAQVKALNIVNTPEEEKKLDWDYQDQLYDIEDWEIEEE